MIGSEIATRVKRQFGDESGVQIDDADIIRWINDAQREITIQNQLLQNIATADVAIGQAAYSLPVDILTMRSVQYNNAKMQFLNYNEAEAFIQNGTTDTGIPTAFYTWANQLYLYPTPSASLAAGLKMFYTRKPVDMTALAETPELPQQYHSRIVEFCLQQAYELDENWSAAQVKERQFSEGVNQLRDNVDWVERDVYPSITSTDYY